MWARARRGRRTIAVAFAIAAVAAATSSAPAGATPTDPGDPFAYGIPEHSPPLCDAQFCVHYVDGGTDAPSEETPAFVLGAADQAFAFQVGKLGWPAPSAPVDLYIENVASRTASSGTDLAAFANQTPSRLAAGIPAFIVLGNSFVRAAPVYQLQPAQIAQLVIAHEFNHVLQVGYAGNLVDEWAAESTATWMMFHDYPNDPGQGGVFDVFSAHPEVPLTSNVTPQGEPGAVYGDGLFEFWLAARYGDHVIRDAWARMRTVSPPGFAVAAFDAAIRAAGGPGFATEFARFATAVAEVSDVKAFPVFVDLVVNDVVRRGTLRSGGSVSAKLDHTSYAMFNVVAPRNARKLTVTATGPRGHAIAFAIIARQGDEGLASEGNSDKVTSTLALAPNGGTKTLSLLKPGRFQRITAVLINDDTSIAGGTPGAWKYRGDRLTMRASMRVTR